MQNVHQKHLLKDIASIPLKSYQSILQKHQTSKSYPSKPIPVGFSQEFFASHLRRLLGSGQQLLRKAGGQQGSQHIHVPDIENKDVTGQEIHHFCCVHLIYVTYWTSAVKKNSIFKTCNLALSI